MNNQDQTRLYLDGAWLRKEAVLHLAMNVGCYAQAEHYLFALLADAVIKGRREAIVEVNKVRELYGVKPIPLSEDDLKDKNELQGKPRLTAAEEKTQQLFYKMSSEEKLDVLRRSMKQLLTEHDLFKHAIHWLGIYMVIRDRLLGGILARRVFIKLANDMVSDDFTDSLRMDENTMKNFSREIKEGDRGKAYYRMRQNPQEALCNTFWSIIQETILTNI